MNPSPTAPRRGVAALALLFANVCAYAHAGGGAGGFAAGFAHPMNGLDHVLAMVAVGLWGAQLGPPQLWLLPVTFPLVMAFGGAIGLMGVPLPAVEVGIALSAVALGAMVLLEAKPDVRISMALIGFFALFHGHAHGAELPAGESGLLYSIGFVCSTGLMHAAGIGVGTIHEIKAGRIALRGAGAIVMAGGLYFLLRSLG